MSISTNPKVKKTAVSASKQEPSVRRSNFDEVAHSYTEEQAVEEASRCCTAKTLNV